VPPGTRSRPGRKVAALGTSQNGPFCEVLVCHGACCCRGLARPQARPWASPAPAGCPSSAEHNMRYYVHFCPGRLRSATRLPAFTCCRLPTFANSRACCSRRQGEAPSRRFCCAPCPPCSTAPRCRGNSRRLALARCHGACKVGVAQKINRRGGQAPRHRAQNPEAAKEKEFSLLLAPLGNKPPR
jgi:hypothetical protein